MWRRHDDHEAIVDVGAGTCITIPLGTYGRSIVFTTTAGTKNQDVVIVGRDGTGLRAIASTDAYEYSPSLSPDGATLLFTREGAIHAVGVDGRNERRLTSGPDDANPTLSPDGSQLAFLRAGSLFVAAADGASPRCVATNQRIWGGPRWQS